MERIEEKLNEKINKLFPEDRYNVNLMFQAFWPLALPANTRLDARLYFPDTGKSIEFSHDNIASNGDQVRYSRTTQIFTRTSELTGGCKIQVKVDKSGATAIVEDFVITILSF